MNNPGNDAQLKQQLLADGHGAFDAGDYTRALDYYHRAALLDNGDPAAWTGLGLCFSNLDFPREAWRSYLLALSIEPRNPDALWYASEFLFELEDLPLADLFLGHYLAVEQDADKLAEARQLRAEIHAEAEARGLSLGLDRGDEAAAVLESEGNAELGAQLEQQPADEAVEPELTADDVRLSDEELEAQALLGERFVPQLALRLSGFEGNCQHCALNIPQDAPYCYSCKMIHFYD
jgi:tetratricopeptide (TPR) repeat protein